MPTMTAGQFADLLEVAPQRVSELIREGLPTTRRGRTQQINAREGIDWLIARKTAAAARALADGEGMLEAKTRKARADANRAQIQAAQAANAVLPRAEVEAMAAQLLALVWDALAPIGDELGPALASVADPAECRRLIFEKTRAARADMACRMEAMAQRGEM